MNVQRFLAAWVLVLAAAGAARGDGCAVVIGVGSDAAKESAKAFAAALTDRAGYRPQRTVVMTEDAPKEEDRPTKGNIPARIEEAAKFAVETEPVVVYFAGRASADDRGVALLAALPADVGDGAVGVPLANVRDALAKSPSQRKILILDLAPASGRAKDLKGLADAAAKVMESSKDTALFVWTGADGALAAKGDPWSAFGVALAEAFSGKADADGDRVLTARELYDYVSKRMAEPGMNKRGVPAPALTGGGFPERWIRLGRFAEATRVTPAAPVAQAEPAVDDPLDEKITAQEAFNRAARTKNRDEQVRWYTKAIELKPDWAAAWQNRGFSYFCMGKNEPAIADFKKTLELDPRNSYACNNLGQIYVDRGNDDEALVWLNKSIEFEPTLAYPYNHRGKAWVHLGKPDLALADFTKSIELMNQHDLSWLNVYLSRARVYYKLKQFDKAWADVKSHRAIGGKVPPDFISDLEDASGIMDEPAAKPKAAADDEPMDKMTAQEAFMRGWRTKDWADQIPWYTKAIELKPDWANAWYNRGNAYYNTGMKPEAIRDLKKAIELQPKFAVAYNTLGQVYMGLDRTDEALECLNKSIELQPTLCYPWNHRGEIYVRQKKWDLALADFTKAIELEPKAEEAWLDYYLHRAKVYYKLQRFDEAWADVKARRALGLKVPPDFISDLEDASGKVDER